MYRIALLIVMSVAGPAVAQTHQVKLNGHTFTLPQGFTIEVAVGADMAPRPIACDFDAKGRLYVTDSSGSNEKSTIQLEKKPHRILRLEDTNGDGKFDKQTVFVKNVMFPEGCMWLNGSLYVAAPPHIWKFTDTNDDGVADKEEIWFDGKTLTGCANDLHGPYRGPDGYIYWTKGAFAEQTYTVNGKKFTTRASHIFRATPDGKNIEPVMTGGMDNPVDLVFTPGGDIIFSTTFFQHPANGKRDGLIHAVYGGVYGKDHSPVYDHPWTSPTLMPVLTHMGPAAPCGLHRYESDQFGKEYANNIYCCQFNLRKVSRHVLVPKGSTYETKDSDFVVSDNIDFHPTDVIEDADGSLLIVDTGGWYKLCCPTSQLVKPDVTGAIYRVKKVGAHKVDDPRGLKIDWAKLDVPALGKLLHDPRPVVRARVIEFVDSHGNQTTPFDVAVAGLTADTTEHGALAATWLVSRDIRPQPLSLAAALTHHPNEEVRKAASHALAVAAPFVDHYSDYAEKRLKDRSPGVRRVAAMAVGRHKLESSIDPIFTALADEKNDRELDHALTYALIEIGNAGEVAEGLKSPSPRVQRACLAALSNMPETQLLLTAPAVIKHLDAKDAALRETAWWVAVRNPQWAAHMGQYLRDRVKELPAMPQAEQEEFATRLAAFLGNADIRNVVADALLVNENPGPPRSLLLAMAASKLKALPEEWRTGVKIALCSSSRDTVQNAIAVLRSVPASATHHAKILEEVNDFRTQRKIPLPAELAHALRATAPVGTELTESIVPQVIRDVNQQNTGPVRAAAADLLTRAKLSNDALESLAYALSTANPLERPKLLGAFEKSKDEKVGLALIAALQSASVLPSIRIEMVKPILDKYPQAVKAEAEKLYAALAKAREGETARLEKLFSELPTGDIRRGQVVFNSQKAQCIACHKMGYVGGMVGPDLTRIGGIRTERDLLEAIVFPSASFVRSYEPVRVVTTDERVLNGVLKKDAPDEIIVVVAVDKEERVARTDVESMTPSAVSLMPAGLDQQLTPQDLADLVAFLKASK